MERAYMPRAPGRLRIVAVSHNWLEGCTEKGGPRGIREEEKCDNTGWKTRVNCVDGEEHLGASGAGESLAYSEDLLVLV